MKWLNIVAWLIGVVLLSTISIIDLTQNILLSKFTQWTLVLGFAMYGTMF
jgi:hypothetical protein